MLEMEFYSYFNQSRKLENPKVIEQLESNGFEARSSGENHLGFILNKYIYVKVSNFSHFVRRSNENRIIKAKRNGAICIY